MAAVLLSWLQAAAGADQRPSAALAAEQSSMSRANLEKGTAAAPVPPKYQALYSDLSNQLDNYSHAVTAMPTTRRHGSAPLVRGVELLDANANRGTALFGPTVLSNVSRDIAHFKAAGVTGLTLGIKLPYLLSSYSGADAGRYLTFYEAVASMIRSHHMTVDVELSAAFCGTAYSSCSFTFPNAVAGFATLTAQQARIVMSKIHPDYLTLISEDTTDAVLSKDPTLDTVAGSAAFVSQALSQIGPHPGVSVGAGAATWEPPAFNQALLKLPIDYLDLHIYPVGPTEVSNLITDTALAKAAHKPVMADEVWLYKDISPTGNPTGTAVSELNDFSFFAPLDARFATITQQWATKAGAVYDSAFWSWQLFGYATWTPTLDSASYDKLSVVADIDAIEAMVAGQVTLFGQDWTEVVDSRAHVFPLPHHCEGLWASPPYTAGSGCHRAALIWAS